MNLPNAQRYARDALAYIESHDMEKVYGSAMKAILEAPQACEVYGPVLGRLLAQGHTAFAERLVREAAAQAEGIPPPLWNTAACLRARLRGDLEGAATLLRRALDGRADPATRTNLGVIRWQQGRSVEAASLWTEVLAQGGGSKRAEYLLCALQAGRNRAPDEAAKGATSCTVFPLLVPSFLPDMEGEGGGGIRMRLLGQDPQGWELGYPRASRPQAIEKDADLLVAAWDQQGLWVGHGRVGEVREDSDSARARVSMRSARFVQRRRSVRIPGERFCSVKVVLDPPAAGSPRRAVPPNRVLDISAGGVCLHITKADEIPHAVEVDVEIGEAGVIRTAAALRRQIRRLTGYEVALEFLASPKTLEAIARQVHARQIERLRTRGE
ncbi:MAG: PilZ domain-containing protein [Planctomycetes bacterium]|nr:PilZ domain-containing protein [Planctomycetota bacterium]